jgi:hypothetical protein
VQDLRDGILLVFTICLERPLALNRPGFIGGQNSRSIAHYGTEIKEENLEAVFTRVARAVRLAMEHRDEYQSEAAALTAIAGKLGCSPDS